MLNFLNLRTIQPSKAFIIFFLTLMSFLVIFADTKPLTPQVLEYLDVDISTFWDYRPKYKSLSCKLMVFSKIKYMYEKYIIDQYVNQTEHKREYLDLLHEKMYNFC